MTNRDFWNSVQQIINDGFDSKGLAKLEEYADKVSNRELIFKRFSPQEQHGCAEAGTSHVIATILAGAENTPDSISKSDHRLKGIFQLGAQQAALIESWARKSGLWIDNVEQTLTGSLGDIILNTPDLNKGGVREFSNTVISE